MTSSRGLAFLILVSMNLSSIAAASRGHESDIAAGGAFTCDFGLASDLSFAQVAPVLERDRMFMAARPGFIRKLVPFRIDPATGALSSGGRYLFATREDANAYRAWATNEFALDGTLFFERPYFLAPDCRAWSVIGAHDFAPLETDHVLVRTERWSVPSRNQRALLNDRWPEIRAAGAARGLASVWLLYDKHDAVVSLVSVANRTGSPDPHAPDFASLMTFEHAPSLAEIFADRLWTLLFDRTHWVLTSWLPFVTGDTGAPSVWPNSPPFPQPFPGDGVCEVSRGENSATAPGDCPVLCGNGVANAGETTADCPGDVRI